MLDQSDQIILPEQIDHYPPNYLNIIIEAIKGKTPSVLSQSSNQSGFPSNTYELRMPLTQPIDMYSLGILLMEIITGCPAQMQLPLTCQCHTIDGQEMHETAPFFGQSAFLGQVDLQHIIRFIKVQSKFINGLPSYLQKHDPYKLTQDAYLVNLVQTLLTVDENLRPSANDVLQGDYLVKMQQQD